MNLEKYDQFLKRVYDSSLDLDGWQATLTELRNLVGGSFANIFVVDQSKIISDPEEALRFFTCDTSMSKDEWWEIGQDTLRFPETCPRHLHALRNPNLPVQFDFQHNTEEELSRYSSYKWYRDMIDGGFYIGGQIFSEGNIKGFATIQRPQKMGHVDKAEIRIFNKLLPHMQRSMNIAYRLGNQGVAANATYDVLDRQPWGVVVLDSAGRVIFANKTATEIDATEDGLRLGRQGITATANSTNRSLQGMITRATAPQHGPDSYATNAIAVLRTSGETPYTVQVMPLPAKQVLFSAARAAAVVFISSPEQKIRPQEKKLEELFDLTPSEATLAVRLALGDSVRDAADALSISYNTARTHLKRIYQKTDIHSQARLAELLFMLSAPVGEVTGEPVSPVAR